LPICSEQTEISNCLDAPILVAPEHTRGLEARARNGVEMPIFASISVRLFGQIATPLSDLSYNETG
jgi:hypothetical protein